MLRVHFVHQSCKALCARSTAARKIAAVINIIIISCTEPAPALKHNDSFPLEVVGADW